MILTDSRVRIFMLAVLVGVIAPLMSCNREPRADLVLYSSVDDYLLRDVVQAFEEQTGMRVDVVGDTEVTKTTGLMQRLLDEKDAPRADVWWSSEPFATVRLAREGVLEPYTSDAAEATFDDGWPDEFRASDDTWYGFALRARVICFNPDLIDASEVPDSIAEFTSLEWSGRFGMSKPRFGTMRGHMAAIAHADGIDGLRAWLLAMKANETPIFESNSSVARGVAAGAREVGLCDTDDVWVVQDQGLPIDFVYERNDGHASFGPDSRGPLVIPNTIALVRGGTHPDAARVFIDFVLSPEVERMMAESDSRNVPVHPEVAADFPDLAIPNPWMPDYEGVDDSMNDAMRLCSEIFVGW